MGTIIILIISVTGDSVHQIITHPVKPVTTNKTVFNIESYEVDKSKSIKNFLATHNIDMDSEVKSFLEKVGRNLERISVDKDMSVHKKFKKSDALVTVRKATPTIGSCSLDLGEMKWAWRRRKHGWSWLAVTRIMALELEKPDVREFTGENVFRFHYLNYLHLNYFHLHLQPPY